MIITLANLAQATEQQIFDQVSAHLIAQGKRSMGPSGCAYRGDGGLKCAAGCLITDDEFKPEMDTSLSTTWTGLMRAGLVPKSNAGFVRLLQDLHDFDHGDTTGFVQPLMQFAEAHKLEFKHEG